MNIIDNREYAIRDQKDKSLLFVMKNSGRDFTFTNKDVVGMDYDIADRLVRGICIDTTRSQKVFHHILSKQIPANLHADKFTRYLPAWTIG